MAGRPGNNVRSLVRASYERIFVGLGLPAVGRWRHRGDAIILAYHNVVPDDVEPLGERSLHLHQSDFIAQIEQLARTHDIVALPDLLEPREATRPRAVVTFDDAYRGAITVALPALAERKIPATVFVAPGILGDQSLWWDALSDPRTGTLDNRLRTHILETHAGRQLPARAWVDDVGREWREVGPFERTATIEELVVASAAGTTTFGSHTWSHTNLQVAEPTLARDELGRSLSWLAERLDRFIPWVSYPFGLVSADSPSLAAESGYVGGLCLSPGWIVGLPRDPLCLPRDNVPSGRSISRFCLRTAGFR